MAASANDKFRSPTSGTRPENAYLTASKSVGASSASVNTTTGWAADTGTDFILFIKDTTSSTLRAMPGTLTTWSCTVSGTTLNNLTLRAGTEPVGGYPSGENSVVIATPTASWADYLVDGLLTSLDQDGTLKAGAVDVAAVLADGVVTAPKLAAGVSVQMVATNSGAVATGTTIIPYDDTIPQITEGTEFMTQAITPKSATNRLFIEIEAYLTNTVVTETVGALFQDATANALAAKAVYSSTATGETVLRVTHDMVAGTASATTFRFRAGPSNAATVTFNGRTGSRKFGGITLSTFKITEYKA